MATEMGIEVKKTLLDGKPFQKILDHARKTNPWVLLLGRVGVHSAKDEKAPGRNVSKRAKSAKARGSTVQNILRGAPSDSLLPARLKVRRLDVRAEEPIRW